ncbi:serine carboxypeptidase [Laetiporus sulphureus 93-53]|uniref:Carboxypeptidase n=1 Tax=Laetiporus sulphureus 93-53 TaxID=1314785 RepID=A0A165EZ80_9APHY|nr:serine carboxypeptidase [Laetiporus sulphureus 93-53]KZT08027.1 serine carboxypeptidase [Laetiporus sulphureus 93-53]
MLLFFTVAALGALNPRPVLGGQVPTLDGAWGASHAQATGHSNVIEQGNMAAVTPGTLRVTENSGVCETTPGVYQASGYGDIAANESIWFWFFEARNDPDTAPFTIWLNGGPGSSSMVGLFQEHGPCRITNDSSSVTYNPYSWNEVSNIMYIDQPVGVGYSYGTLDVGTSEEAAKDVWTFLQIFFSDPRYSKYQERDFALWTESYGGHYGPTFAAYFLEQNAKVADGTVSGLPINLKYLGVGDGLTDPLSQYPGYLSYAASNPYHPLVSTSEIETATYDWNKTDGCMSQITACYDNGSDETCSAAQDYCNSNILSPLAGDYDVYYVLSTNPDPYPPDPTPYLNNATLMAEIGADSNWTETNYNVYLNFANTGDWMRNSAPDLEVVIDAGVRTVIYDGDADYILNYKGVEAMVAHLQTRFSSEFARQKFATWTVHGEAAGIYKNAGTFSYVRIFGAGHEVAAYEYGDLSRGEAALQMFSQIMSDRSLYST